MDNQSLKGGEKKVEEVQITRTGYREQCPYCKSKLGVAGSESQAKWNLEIHLKACEKNPSNKVNGKQ